MIDIISTVAAVALLLVGVFLSIRLKFPQVRHFKHSFRCAFSRDTAGGGISPFASLCTALSATVGTGNIVGVATAVCLGGEGALFWMALSAFFGMATKYAEGALAVKYRVTREGKPFGGPFYYIERGLGRRFRPLAAGFAFFGCLSGLFGIGTLTQSGSIMASLDPFLPREHSLKLPLTVAIALVLATAVGFCLAGGVERVARVSEKIIPAVSLLFILVTVLPLVVFFGQIPAALCSIFRGAFTASAAFGGGVGAAVRYGVGRGVFSHEAGLGSAPIASAAGNESDPYRAGLAAMTGTFIDTLLLCTLTGLSIVLTKGHLSSLSGGAVTAAAWSTAGLPQWLSRGLLAVFLTVFAVTSILGWSVYSEACFSYLFRGNRSALYLFRGVYALSVFVGCFLSADTVWALADIFCILMAFPNLVALVLLRREIVNVGKSNK